MEAAMNRTNATNDSHHSGTPMTGAANKGLHPRVYGVLIGLCVWLVLSVWLFAGGGVTDYLLFVVSGFIFLVVALAVILSRVRRDDTAPTTSAAQPPSFHDWAAADFDTWQGRLRGKEAAVQIILPIAAVAIGMTIFGAALHYAEHEGPLPTTDYSSGSVVKNSG
jgi:hypothetical protein